MEERFLPGDRVTFNPECSLHTSARKGLGLVINFDDVIGKYEVYWPDDPPKSSCYPFELIKYDRATEAVLFEVIKRLIQST